MRALSCAWMAVVVCASAPAFAGNAVKPGAFRSDPPTLRCISFRWYLDGDDNGNATCTLRYRKVGDARWKEALPLLRVNRESVGSYRCGNLLAGSVMFLQPATEYEANLVLSDPDGGKAEKTVRVTTRGVPRAPQPLRTLYVYPQDYAGKRKAPAFASFRNACNALKPGDLLLVHPGEYKGNVAFSVQASAERTVVIRWAGGGEAVIRGKSGSGKSTGFNLVVSGSRHVFIEKLTLRGGDWAIRGEDTQHLVVRRCKILEVSTGIRTYSATSRNWYIADNEITGINKAWYPRPGKGYMSPAHTGINLYGRGHVVCYNRIRKFGDCLAIANFGAPKEDVGLHCVAIDFHNNDLFEAKDDPLETDYGCHNIRVWRNRLYSGHTGVSAQPLFGGPVYFIRNEMYGITALCYKFHNYPSGIYVLHNTSVSAHQAFRSAHIWQNATFRNNLFLGVSRYSMESGSPDRRTSLDYNGWYKTADPERFIKWHDGKTWTRYPDLAAFAKGTGNGRHSILIDYGAFVRASPPVKGTTYEPGAADLRLIEGAKAIDAGVRLPGINDDFTGKAPDLGCYEFGRIRPHYGPRPEKVWPRR